MLAGIPGAEVLAFGIAGLLIYKIEYLHAIRYRNRSAWPVGIGLDRVAVMSSIRF